VRATQLKVGGEYARSRERSMETPERLVLLELQGKGWVMVRRDDGEQERVRTSDLLVPSTRCSASTRRGGPNTSE
jgi:flagellar basal body rod protein FlgF